LTDIRERGGRAAPEQDTADTATAAAITHLPREGTFVV